MTSLRLRVAGIAAGSLILLSPALAGAATLPSATPPVNAAQAAAAAAGTRLILTSLTPSAVTPDDQLVITGKITNTGAAPLPKLRVSLKLSEKLLVERTDVRTWTAKGAVDDLRPLPGAATVAPIAPGATAAFTITVPPGDLGLPRARGSFGPRGIAVEATADDAGAERIALSRSTIVWYPGKEFQPTQLTLLAPVTAPRNTDVADPDDRLAAAMSPGGSLQRLLAATDDQVIGWALDPALLEAARNLSGTGGDGSDSNGSDSNGTASSGSETGDATPTPSAGATPTPSSTTSPEERKAAGDWLDAVRAGREGRDLVTLPFADPDLTAVTRAKAGGILRAADELAADVTRDVFGTALTPDVAWPADGAVDRATLVTLQRYGRRAVILGSATQPLVERVDHTSTGRSTIPAGQGALDGLLYDEQLSTLFGNTGSEKGTAATQQLISELAAITLERPGDSRNVFAVAPRGWDPDPKGVEAAIDALRTTPWISLRTLNHLRGTEPPAARVLPRYSPKISRNELPQSHVTAVATLFDEITDFGPALLDPAPVVDPILARCLMLVSAAWRRDRLDLGAARSPVAREAHDLVGGVHIVRSSSRPYFLASKASLPVYVANGTPYPVRVVVALRPKSGGLVIDRPVEVTLDPNTRRQQVLVPTRALASGDVQIAASVRTPGGQVIGSERDIVVQVRREWETRGIIVVGTLLALLLAVGLMRGVRRDRTRVRPEDVPDLDDLASAAGDRAAARRDALEDAARGEGTGEGTGEASAVPATESDETGARDGSSQEGRSGRAVASPDSASGDVAVDVGDARDRPVMSREHR